MLSRPLIMAYHQVLDGGDSLQIWRIAVTSSHRQMTWASTGQSSLNLLTEKNQDAAKYYTKSQASWALLIM
jgi:hypothetical protein